MREALEVAPGEELDLDIGVPLAELADLSVLAGDEGLLHHRHLEICVLLREIEVRREGLEHAAVLVLLEDEGVRLVLPGDSVEVENPGAFDLRVVGEMRRIRPRMCLEIRRFLGHL